MLNLFEPMGYAATRSKNGIRENKTDDYKIAEVSALVFKLKAQVVERSFGSK